MTYHHNNTTISIPCSECGAEVPPFTTHMCAADFILKRAIADRDKRIDGLLQECGSLLERARAAEGRVESLVKSLEVAAETNCKVMALLDQRATSENHPLTALMEKVKIYNSKWWVDLETGEPINRNVGEVLALIHSEISEALEGHRRDLMDNHLPHRKMFTAELADAIIRILDCAAHLAPDLEEVLMEKLEYNRNRCDHKEESRRLANGKKY